MAKKNLIKIPSQILNSIQRFDQDDVVVAIVKFVQQSDLYKYLHLGLKLVEGNLIIPPPTIPTATEV